MYKQRKLYSQIKPYLEHKNAIVITGARQVGKTTFLKHIYENMPDKQKIWFDLENPLNQKIFEEFDYDIIYKNIINFGLKKDKKIYVFIDEIQNFPEITKIIKYLIDHYKIKFFVTGSSSFYMRNLFPESLSGRKFVFNLYPLDFQEFLYFKGLIPKISYKKTIDLRAKAYIDYKKFEFEFNEYIEFGGFPEVVLADSNEEKKMIMENIFKSFFEKDILQLADYKDIREIRDLILLLSKRIGSKIDVTRIASELGVNRYKIYSYLDFLQATFIIRLINVYSNSIDKKVAAGKKIYFLDTGLVNQIAKIGEGELFENAVANLLIKYGEISYFQASCNREIDFILNNEIAFETKLKGTKVDLSELSRSLDRTKIKKHFIISKAFAPNLDRVIYPQFL